MSVKEGEIVVILEEDAGGSGWTGVQTATAAGFVPSSYLRMN